MMTKTTLHIEGMACNRCETHMNDAVRNHFDVKKVTSSHTEGETVILSETELDAGKLAEVVAATGYKLLDIQTEPYVKKGLFGRIR